MKCLYRIVQRKPTLEKTSEGADRVAKAGLHPMFGEILIKYYERLTRLDAAIRETVRF